MQVSKPSSNKNWGRLNRKRLSCETMETFPSSTSRRLEKPFENLPTLVVQHILEHPNSSARQLNHPPSSNHGPSFIWITLQNPSWLNPGLALALMFHIPHSTRPPHLPHVAKVDSPTPAYASPANRSRPRGQHSWHDGFSNSGVKAAQDGPQLQPCPRPTPYVGLMAIPTVNNSWYWRSISLSRASFFVLPWIPCLTPEHSHCYGHTGASHCLLFEHRLHRSPPAAHLMVAW